LGELRRSNQQLSQMNTCLMDLFYILTRFWRFILVWFLGGKLGYPVTYAITTQYVFIYQNCLGKCVNMKLIQSKFDIDNVGLQPILELEKILTWDLKAYMLI
jgi:hypothetical protein